MDPKTVSAATLCFPQQLAAFWGRLAQIGSTRGGLGCSFQGGFKRFPGLKISPDFENQVSHSYLNTGNGYLESP